MDFNGNQKQFHRLLSNNRKTTSNEVGFIINKNKPFLTQKRNKGKTNSLICRVTIVYSDIEGDKLRLKKEAG